MKIKKPNILLAVPFAAIIAFTGCTKDDGPIRESVTIYEVPAITTNIDPTGSQSISLASPATFSGKFKVDLYFSGATPPTKVDIVVRKNNLASTTTNNNVKLYKADVTSLPANFTVTVAEIQALFGGTAIALKDVYDFAPDIYFDGKKYEAFPTIGNGTNTGVRAMPNFSEFTRFEVK
jgi:hypothetical protein